MSDEESDDDTGYTPVYYDDDEGLPNPEGQYGMHIQRSKTEQDQRQEAARMLTFIKSDPSLEKLGALATTTAPTPLLVKAPGNNSRVRFILGLSPVLSDPFMAITSPLEGKLLAISQDISSTDETPMPITLTEDILKLNMVNVPTDAAFETKVKENNDGGEGKKWFVERSVTAETNLPHAIPLPLYLAYDALGEDVDAHVVWERIKCTNLDDIEEVEEIALAFLKAAHTLHKKESNCIALADATFTQRATIHGKRWAKERAMHLFPDITPATTPATPSTPTRRSDLLALADAIAAKTAGPSAASTPELAGDSEEKTFKKFGLCTADLHRILLMCGKETGEEESLPAWFEEIATKHMLNDGKAGVIRKLLNAGLKFDEYPIPITTSLINMIIKKTFSGDEDATTAAGAMKGLSPYTMTAMTAEELEETNTYEAAVSASSAATVEDLQRLLNKKAKTPGTFSALLIVLRTFTNLLGRLFGPTCPLYMAMLSQCIKPLTLMTQKARTAMATTTLASIMWAVYKQTKRFALGQMHGNEAIVAEWACMAQHITCKQNFNLLEVPVSISGTDNPDPDQKPLKSKRKKDDDDTGEKEKPTKRVRLKMEIHPFIKKDLTDALPRRFSVKNLCNVCDIKGVNNVFPGTNLCLQGALKGFCPFPSCDRVHDGQLVTDDLATKALSLFDPFLKDPSILKTRG